MEQGPYGLDAPRVMGQSPVDLVIVDQGKARAARHRHDKRRDPEPRRPGVGEKIGVWPIFSLSEDEVVAGRDNKHMDFRLSVLKVPDGDRPSVVVSTICTVHNLSGKLYLFFVVPFHRQGVRKLMTNALAARRL